MDIKKQFGVIKFDVVSPDLKRLNKIFTKIPHTNEFDYHPHVTIAYVKLDRVDKYVKLFSDKLK